MGPEALALEVGLTFQGNVPERTQRLTVTRDGPVIRIFPETTSLVMQGHPLCPTLMPFCGFAVLGVPDDGAMLQAQMVLDQVISLVTTHWQQDVSEVYVCTSFVQGIANIFLADVIDQSSVWPEVRNFTCCCRIDSTAITRDNLYFRIFSEPGCQRTLITAGKQDEGR